MGLQLYTTIPAFCFEKGSSCVAQDGLKLIVLLPSLPSACYRCATHLYPRPLQLSLAKSCCSGSRAFTQPLVHLLVPVLSPSTFPKPCILPFSGFLQTIPAFSSCPVCLHSWLQWLCHELWATAWDLILSPTGLGGTAHSLCCV